MFTLGKPNFNGYLSSPVREMEDGVSVSLTAAISNLLLYYVKIASIVSQFNEICVVMKNKR